MEYTQSGINAAARIVEVVSGMTFDVFVQKRISEPLGMKDTTFYPTDAQRARLATAYAKNKETGALEAVPPRPEFGPRDRPPQGNGGLYSTAPDYARFAQMLLSGGKLGGHTYLSAAAMKFLTTSQTGDIPTGFLQSDTYGNRGANYSWGIATCILRAPHDGVAAVLSPGTYGPGGAWYESGPDAVFAQAPADRPSRFIRVMVLPRALLGKSSIQLLNEEDKAKPRSQQYKIFADAPIAFRLAG